MVSLISSASAGAGGRRPRSSLLRTTRSDAGPVVGGADRGCQNLSADDVVSRTSRAILELTTASRECRGRKRFRKCREIRRIASRRRDEDHCHRGHRRGDDKEPDSHPERPSHVPTLLNQPQRTRRELSLKQHERFYRNERSLTSVPHMEVW